MENKWIGFEDQDFRIRDYTAGHWLCDPEQVDISLLRLKSQVIVLGDVTFVAWGCAIKILHKIDVVISGG